MHLITSIDQIFSPEAIALIDPEHLERAKIEVALAPVRCVDCGEYFPLGWIAQTSAPYCPKGKQSSGDPWWHRVSHDVIENVVDGVANRYLATQEG